MHNSRRKTTLGRNVRTGIGDYAENIFNSEIYKTKITVIGSDTIVPDNTNIGCNVVIDNKISAQDIPSSNIPSGYALLKGGDGNV